MSLLVEAKRSKAEIAFDKATRSAFSDWKKNETEVFRKVDQILKDYQVDILGDIAYTTEWDLRRVEAVKKSIEAARSMTDARISHLWRDEANKAAALSILKVDSPLIALGLPVEHVQAGIALPQLAVLQEYVPSLIQGVTLETQQRVTSLMQHAVLGGVDQREILRQVGKAVGPLNTKKRPDHTVFSKAHVRARTIMRTEMNRLNNLAVTNRAAGLSEKYPGVGLKWLHRGSPDPRSGHTALNGEIIHQADGDKFKLVGSDGTVYLVDGPHDPTLPAEHSINCHCGTRVVYDSKRGLKAAKDSPYIAGDGSNIPSAGGVKTESPKKKTAAKAKPKKKESKPVSTVEDAQKQIRINSPVDMNKAGLKKTREYWNGFGTEEIEALDKGIRAQVIRYQQSGAYRRWNNHLRTGASLIDTESRNLVSLKKAFQVELKEDHILWRGSGNKKLAKGIFGADDPMKMVGLEIQERGLCSTSLTSAGAFAKEISFEILAPKGIKVCPMGFTRKTPGFVSDFARELEVLLPPDTWFEVLAIEEKSGSSGWHCVLKVVEK